MVLPNLVDKKLDAPRKEYLVDIVQNGIIKARGVMAEELARQSSQPKSVTYLRVPSLGYICYAPSAIIDKAQSLPRLGILQ